MLKHQIKLIFRNFKKDKGTFLINLIGLSTGLACTILVLLWVMDEYNIDKFHENDSQLYKMISTFESDGEFEIDTDLPCPLADALLESFPEVKMATSNNAWSVSGITSNDIHLNVEGRYVKDNFFQVFSFEMIEGNQEKIFPNENSIVLSESTARKLYKSPEKAIGKLVSFESFRGKKEVIVSGIFKNVPVNSTMQFDYLLSFDLFENMMGENADWNNYVADVHVLLDEGVTLVDFNSKVENFFNTRDPDNDDKLFAQKFSDYYLNGVYENGVQVGGRMTYVRLFSIIAFFILLIACINFMNLSTAKASQKYKEIGVKKTIGADRRSLIFQYLGESTILSLMALVLAIIMVLIAIPQFNLITGKEVVLRFTSMEMLFVFGMTILTGLLAGSYPAFYLSSFEANSIFRGKIQNSLSEILARKGLVVFQFCISIILIVAVLVISNQIEFIQDKNLGYNRDNVIHFDFDSTPVISQQSFIEEVKNIAGVNNASSLEGDLIDSNQHTNGSFDWKGMDPDKNYVFYFMFANYNLLDLLDIDMLKGRTFSKEFGEETEKIILNKAGAALTGLENPIGEKFNLWGTDYEIIGVTEDFHFQSFYENIKPMIIRLSENELEKVFVKIEEGQSLNTIAQLEKKYKEAQPGKSFDYTFLDSDFQALYISEQRVATLSQYFAGFAILISCLGLFGLATFTAQRRIKEISIRKVLGANRFSIVHLLTLDFTKMVLLAILIGLPLSYLLAKNWLTNFAFHIDLTAWYFLIAGIVVLAIAWITVSIQTFKAASVNPTNNLKE